MQLINVQFRNFATISAEIDISFSTILERLQKCDHGGRQDRRPQEWQGNSSEHTGSRPNHFDDAARIPPITMGSNKAVNV